MTDKILIVDFGSQFTQLISRRLRELNILSNSIRPEVLTKFDFDKVKGIILSGGPNSVSLINKKHREILEIIFEKKIPILGICYGFQILCQLLGGKISFGKKREFGKTNLQILENSPLFSYKWKVNKIKTVWMSHGDHVSKLPKNFKLLASSENLEYSIAGDTKKKYYGIQFHPEVSHTQDGNEILKNFSLKICKIKTSWTISNYKNLILDDIRQKVGNAKVILGLSGGVDSAVAAALISKSIGKNLHCLLIDTGFMREGEIEEIVKFFKENFELNIININKSDLFFNKIKNVKNPERKRKIIGRNFIKIFEEEAKKIKGVEFLAQGTLYPDVIESLAIVGEKKVTIKSHHTVGGLPKKMKLKLLEPLKLLFKDEVREIGRSLGIPKKIIDRHPFPGPGLAIRIIGNVSKEKVKIIKQADKLFIEQLKKSNLYNKIWQAFTVLLPVKTVGVMGDNRTYEYVCVLRAVTSKDGMSAECYNFSSEFIKTVATKIVNEVEGINRVVYDHTNKPPGTIEWE